MNHVPFEAAQNSKGLCSINCINLWPIMAKDRLCGKSQSLMASQKDHLTALQRFFRTSTYYIARLEPLKKHQALYD